MSEKLSPKEALARAIDLAGGKAALARKITERREQRGMDSARALIAGPTIYQWEQNRVPAEHCPDVEAITGVRCEELRPDVNWAVLRSGKAKARA